ncbi:MAG: zinc metalloprotease [Marmoricola sp.]
MRTGVLGAGLVGLALPVLGMFAVPAGAVVPRARPAAGTTRACVNATGDHQRVPAVRRYADTSRVSAKDLQALSLSRRSVPPMLRVPMAIRHARKLLPHRVVVPVAVHVISGTRKGERTPVGPKRVHRLIRVLNRGFHGKESGPAPRTRYDFRLWSIDHTRREGWYHAFLNGPRDQRMKRKLHRGGAHVLNLYINRGGPRHGAPVLGWSRFPWQYHAHPRLDGVSVNRVVLPGGTAKHYNHGDTVVHETGHWMGLFHTFQGGCRGRGDHVADTPAEGRPSYRCDHGRNTCRNRPGNDPIHNFMDYSYDSCMTEFTPGQVRRMDRSYATWRR